MLLVAPGLSTSSKKLLTTNRNSFRESHALWPPRVGVWPPLVHEERNKQKKKGEPSCLGFVWSSGASKSRQTNGYTTGVINHVRVQ